MDTVELVEVGTAGTSCTSGCNTTCHHKKGYSAGQYAAACALELLAVASFGFLGFEIGRRYQYEKDKDRFSADKLIDEGTSHRIAEAMGIDADDKSGAKKAA